MSRPLAVLVPVLGVRTETFIRRHILDLFPGGTVVVADSDAGPLGGHWSVECPSLLMQNVPSKGRFRRAVERVRRSAGWRRTDNDERVEGFLRGHSVRVVMGEYLDCSLRWAQNVQAVGARFFGHAHGYDVSRRLREAEWRAKYLRYNQADGVITMSEFSKARLVAIGVDAEKIHVIPYGIDVPPRELKRPSPGGAVRCLAVGRMVGKKAPILTLDAVRRAIGDCPQLTLDYVGEGELLPAVRQFIRAFGLEDRVTLHGGQSHETVRRLMKEADIFVQHSITDPDSGDEEGLPVAILEAMAHGLPVVSTRHAGIPECVTEGENGFLVDEGDSTEMGARLSELAQDPALRSRMGEMGWRRAERSFSWELERSELLRVLGLDPAEALARSN
jgi:colanic acid/amylovoran biosynthesis glycosyltransferase